MHGLTVYVNNGLSFAWDFVCRSIFIDIHIILGIGALTCMLIFLCLDETHNTLQLPVFFFLWLCQLYWECQGIQSKKLFYRPPNSYYNTILEIQFRSLKWMAVIRIQKFEQLSIPNQVIQGKNSVLM